MRTRLLAAVAAAVLTLPLASAAASASSSERKCDDSISTEHNCEEARR
jgi:hypothetical protein